MFKILFQESSENIHNLVSMLEISTVYGLSHRPGNPLRPHAVPISVETWIQIPHLLRKFMQIDSIFDTFDQVKTASFVEP